MSWEGLFSWWKNHAQNLGIYDLFTALYFNTIEWLSRAYDAILRVLDTTYRPHLQPIDNIVTSDSTIRRPIYGLVATWWSCSSQMSSAKQYANDCNPLTSSHAGNNKDLTPVSSTAMSASTSRKVRPHPFQGDHNKTSPGEITPPFPNFISEVGSLEVAWKTCLKTLLP